MSGSVCALVCLKLKCLNLHSGWPFQSVLVGVLCLPDACQQTSHGRLTYQMCDHMCGKQCVLSTHSAHVWYAVCAINTSVYMCGKQCLLSTHQCTCVVSSVCYQHTVHMRGKQCVLSTHQCTCVVSSVCCQRTVYMRGEQCVLSTHSAHAW